MLGRCAVQRPGVEVLPQAQSSPMRLPPKAKFVKFCTPADQPVRGSRRSGAERAKALCAPVSGVISQSYVVALRTAQASPSGDAIRSIGCSAADEPTQHTTRTAPLTI